MNRQQRRAAARKRLRVPAIRIGEVTIPEAEVLTEALDMYVLSLEEEVEPHQEQVWALGRAKALRDMLQAGIDNKPIYDAHAEREP